MEEEYIENEGFSFYKEDKGEHENFAEELEEQSVEYADVCYKCQESHYNRKGFVDGEFPVVCKGIPKSLIDEKYGDAYSDLDEEQKIQKE